MPEMKRNFTKGKMNKDLDERLVPNGEYRDAMNIQVSTSEGSDVGTIQNVLGNTPGCDVNIAPVGSYTVGSVSDEKNDTLYWLVSGQTGIEPEMSDMILRRKVVNGQVTCEPVFVDKYAFTVPNPGITTDVDTLDLYATLPIYNQIYEGWTVTGITDNGSTSNTVTINGITVGDAFVFVWNYTVSNVQTYISWCVGNTINPMQPCNANTTYIPLGSPDANGDYYISLGGPGSGVYIAGYLSGTPLVGGWIDIDTDNGLFGSGNNPYGYEITAENPTSIVVGGLGMNVIQLSLDSPLVLDPSISGIVTPSFIDDNGWGWLEVDYSSITEATPIFATVPDNGWITLPPQYDVNDYVVNDQITLDPNTPWAFDGCVIAIDSSGGNNFLQVADCADNSIFATPSIVTPGLPNPYAVDGDIVLDNSLFVDLGGVDLILSDDNYTSLIFQGPRTLNFDHGDLILGINIIDDFLFWTDNKTEPKKISISRSIAGTDPTGTVHTDVILPDSSGNLTPGINRGPAREEHITVIKKAPHRPPTLKMSSQLKEGSTGEGYILENMVGGGVINHFNAVGDTVYVEIEDLDGIAPDFVVGDTIGLVDGQLGGGDIFLDGYQIRLRILEINTGPWTNPSPGGQTIAAGFTSYLVEVIFMNDSGLNAGPLNSTWYFELVDDEKYLFERKFPRFAYRYKYVDNEYSTYGPFSDVAFMPDTFRYEPVKAYNEGMTNKLRTLTLQDFVPSDIPKDVVQIDILYKNEHSPIVYLMDSIRENDAPLLANAWHKNGSVDIPNSSTGSYEITTENIYAALPANQSLRTWDNVPLVALGQEVTGNRIIYGNYIQGHSMEEIEGVGGGKLIPNINVSLAPRTDFEEGVPGQKSIKSLRDYDIGVVWGDKYGRETPVITPSSGSFVVPKVEADQYNYFQTTLDKSPHWAEYYRFYIKETSNQYYNLAVDRIYDAEDGNIWVSFPSVDRNKVDEDTYIILKKGSDNDDLIVEKAKYKIVAIENEAPEFIKTNYERLVRTNTDDSRLDHSCQMFGGRVNVAANGNIGSGGDLTNGCPIYPNTNGALSYPTLGSKTFSIDKDHWTETHSVTNKKMGLPDLKKLFNDINEDFSSDEFYVSFTKETTNANTGHTSVISGSKYRVLEILNHSNDTDADRVPINITFDDPNYQSAVTVNAYEVKLASPIVSTDEFIVSGYNAVSGQLLADDIHIHFWKKTIRNKPEFDGRFFVKIYSDEVDRENLSRTGAQLQDWAVVTTVPLYNINDSNNLSNDADPVFNFNPAQTSLTKTENDWKEFLKFGGSYIKSGWFIDHASFAGRQPLESNKHNNVITQFTNFQNQPVPSCDTSSNVSFDWVHDGVVTLVFSDSDYFGTGASYGSVGMKGAHTGPGGEKRLDISYSQLGPDGPGAAGGEDGKTEDYNLDWRVGDLGNPAAADEIKVIQSLSHGKRFRLQGSDIIYKITGPVQKFRLFNYQGKKTATPKKTWEVPNYEWLGSITFWNNAHYNDQLPLMVDKINRRHTYRITYDVDMHATDPLFVTPDPGGNPLSTPDDITTPYTYTDAAGNVITVDVFGDITNLVSGGAQQAGQLEFLTEFNVDGDNEISSNPAIFETEPKEDADLDLYYEASSSFPTFPITNSNIKIYIPIGSTIVLPSSLLNIIPDGIFISGHQIVIPGSPTIIVDSSTPLTINQFTQLASEEIITFLRDDGTYVTAKIISGPTDTILVNGVPTLMVVSLEIEPLKTVGLSWSNCWSFGNGVESNRIGDTYNKPFLTNGVAVSSIIDDNYKEEHKKYSLTYSGLYNSNSGINSLNQFIAGEKITKDLNPIYGSIQRLKAGWGQGGDLVALCEDRILRILADKDALYNADGNTNVTATNRVLGTATPYSGEYGISKNPESFASEAYRAYFTDKVRGAVMRLSRDGLTPISDAGMKDWFRDNLKLNNKLVGSFDDKKDEYNITLPTTVDGISKTVSFREDVRGWVSFKSFVTTNGVSCANDYFTFKEGELWLHHHDVPGNRNTFYNIFTKSTFDVLLNDAPDIVKSFHTLNYEGSDSKVTLDVLDNQYHNLVAKPGWHVDSIFTNKETGNIYEFIEKEGKWFNYIRGNDILYNPDTGSSIDVDTFDEASFSIQGLGALGGIIAPAAIPGCMDANAGPHPNTNNADSNGVPCIYPCANGFAADNYDPTATVDDGSCNYPVSIGGCMEPTSTVYSTQGFVATYENGSCTWGGCVCDPNLYPDGCTNPTSFDQAAQLYNGLYPGAIFDNGSCTAIVEGCTDPAAFNYNPNANTEYPVSNCVPVIEGCMGQNAINATQATNYGGPGNNNSVVPPFNTDNGSCIWSYCDLDVLDDNYNALAITESTGYIFDTGNYPSAGVTTNDCTSGGCTDPTADNYTEDANGIPINDLGNIITWDDGSCDYGILGCTDPLASAATYNPLATVDDGSCLYPSSVMCGDWNNNGTLTCSDPYNHGLQAGSGYFANYNSCQLAIANNYFPCQSGQTGCTDPTAFNYDPTATVDDGSCTPYIYGCTDNTALNHDQTANTDCDANNFGCDNVVVMCTGPGNNGCCNYGAPGCTNPLAINYDPTATVDDGSCIMPIFGCIDPIAENYDPAANTADNPSSCTYDGWFWGPTPGNQGVSSCRHQVNSATPSTYTNGCDCCQDPGNNGLIYDSTDQEDGNNGTYTMSCCQWSALGVLGEICPGCGN